MADERKSNKAQHGINNEALEYLKQKYNDEFEYVSPWGSSYTTPGMRQIIVECGSLPGKEILVVINGNGVSTVYRDNFMDFFYEARTSDFVKKAAQRFFDNFSVTINIIRAPSAVGVSPSTGFEDYILNKGQIIDAHIVVNKSNEKTLQEFLNDLVRLGVHFSFDVDIVSNNECYTAQFFYSDSEVFLERREFHCANHD